MRSATPASLIVIALTMTPAAAQTSPEIAAAMADIEAKSIASSPIGSWAKYLDGDGKEVTFSVAQKTQGKDGWQVTTSMVPSAGSKVKAGSVTVVLGSAAMVLKGAPIQKMGEESVKVGGATISCKVFSYANGQRKWMSASIPGGGTVKVVGPEGKPYLTVSTYGKP